mgnify:FL=1
MALQGKTSVMVTINRNKGSDYGWSLGEACLSKVANKEKKLPRSFITRDGFGITKRARNYLNPLIEGEDHPPYKNGLQHYVSLKKVMVEKKIRRYSSAFE